MISTLDIDDDGDGFTENQNDCDDNDPTVSPSAPEVENGIDDNCNGTIDEGTNAYDDDGDGFSENDGDCNDTTIAINPDAVKFAAMESMTIVMEIKRTELRGLCNVLS